MIPDALEVSVSTTGTASAATTLTTSDVSNRASVNDLTDSVVVPYILESGNSDTQWGYGHATSTDDRFVIDTISGVNASGTPDQTSPSAITLSGASSLYVGPHVGTSEVLHPFVSTIADGTYAYVCDTRGAQFDNASVTCVANRVWYLPFHLSYPGEYDAFHVVVPSTGSNLKMGLYSVNTSGEPGVLLAVHDTSFVPSAGGNDLTFDGGDLFLWAGDYFIGLLMSASSGNIRGHNTASSPVGSLGYRPSAEKPAPYIYQTQTYASGMPTSPGSFTATSSSRAQAVLRRA